MVDPLVQARSARDFCFFGAQHPAEPLTDVSLVAPLVELQPLSATEGAIPQLHAMFKFSHPPPNPLVLVNKL